MKKIWIFVSAILLSACQAVQLPNFIVDDFKNSEPIKLKTTDISVTSNVHYGLTAPFIEYKMPVTPEQALKQWAHNRFVAAAPDSAIETVIVIEKASMTEQEKPSDKWYVLNNVEYVLDFQVKIAFIMDRQTISEQTVGGYEKRSLPIKCSLMDKEEAWSDMLNDMVEKVNKKMLTDIPDYFFIQPPKNGSLPALLGFEKE